MRMNLVPCGVLLALVLSGCASESAVPGTADSASATASPSSSGAPSGEELHGTESGGNESVGGDQSNTLVNGINARAAWNACVDRGREQYAEVFVSNEGFRAESVQPVASQVAGATGVIVTVEWVMRHPSGSVATTWLCVATGDPYNPTVASADMPDK